jgi:non-ribosomal peptide synthetase component F
VVVSHGNIASYLSGLSRVVDYEKIRSAAALGTFGADLTYTALFVALSRGLELRLIERSEIFEPAILLERLTSRPVDLLKAVPSLIGALLELDGSGSWLPREYLLLGGEAIRRSLLEALELLRPGCTIVNHYGPTETTVGVTADVIDWSRAGLFDVGASVIGRGFVEDGCVAVVDESFRPAPVGVVGEIGIAGASNSSGYLGDPRLTAERFVPSPLAGACCPMAGSNTSAERMIWSS